MASLQSLALGRRDVLQLDPRIIQEDPGWNKRHESPELTEHIRTLANSIREIGVQVPLMVRLINDVPVVRDGHCRLKATMLAISEGAEIASIPVITPLKGTSEADDLADQLTRNSGKPLTPLEVADVAMALLGKGWTVKQIADRAGKGEDWINRLLKLREAPSELRQEVQAGTVSASLASELVASEGPEKAVEMVKEAKAAKQESTGEEKARVTKKDLTGPRKRVDWPKVGPLLKKEVEKALTTTDPTKALEKLNQFYEKTFAA